MEADGAALALEHGALQVVVQNDAGRGAKEAEGLDVPAEEARHRGPHREVHEAHPAEGEHHDEGEERTFRATDAVILLKCAQSTCALSPGRTARRTQASAARRGRSRLSRWRGSRSSSRVAARDHHRPETARAKPGYFASVILDEGHVRVDEAPALRVLRDGQAAVRKHALHRVVVADGSGWRSCRRASPRRGGAEGWLRLLGRDRLMRRAHDATSRRARGCRPRATRGARTPRAALAWLHAPREHAPAARAVDHQDRKGRSKTRNMKTFLRLPRLHRRARTRGSRRRAPAFRRDRVRYATPPRVEVRLPPASRCAPRRGPRPAPVDRPVRLDPPPLRARHTPGVNGRADLAEHHHETAARTPPEPTVQRKIAAPLGAAGRARRLTTSLSVGERAARSPRGLGCSTTGLHLLLRAIHPVDGRDVIDEEDGSRAPEFVRAERLPAGTDTHAIK